VKLWVTEYERGKLVSIGEFDIKVFEGIIRAAVEAVKGFCLELGPQT